MAAREAPARSAADARTARESLYKSVSLVGFRNGEASSFRSPNSGDDPPLPWPLYGQRGACTREEVLRAPVRPRSYLASRRRLLRRPALRALERHPMRDLPLYGRPGALPLEVRATGRAVARSPVHRDQAVPSKAPRLAGQRKAARLLDGRRSAATVPRGVEPRLPGKTHIHCHFKLRERPRAVSPAPRSPLFAGGAAPSDGSRPRTHRARRRTRRARTRRIAGRRDSRPGPRRWPLP